MIHPTPAARHKVGEGKARRHHAHEHQQFKNRQDGNEELKGGGDGDPHHIEAHEYHVGPRGRDFRVQARELHIQVSADGQGNGRGRKNEFDQGCHTGQIAAGGAKGVVAVSKGATGVGNAGGQLGEAENEGAVHHGHHEGGHQKAQGTGSGPAEAPAKVFAGNYQAHGNAPQLPGAQACRKLRPGRGRGRHDSLQKCWCGHHGPGAPAARIRNQHRNIKNRHVSPCR